MKKKGKGLNFFLIALLAHLAVLAIFGPKYVVSPFRKEALLKGKLKEKRKAAAVPEKKKPTIEKRVTAEVPVHLLKKKPVARRDVQVKRKVKIPTGTKIPRAVAPKDVKVSRKHGVGSDRIITQERARRRTTYKKFAKKFHVSGKGKTTKASFTPVLTKYLKGDWNKDKKSLPNLMREINKRSNISANEKPKIVSVSSEEMFDCPFVYFTGTKDFKLTEEEVMSLRKYLLQGGFVWADNGLAGRRSRFDIAFRREMKRVLPDRNFEPIPITHPMFTSFYKFKEVPSAMNYRDDPLEMMKIDKRIVVMYTLNAYVPFWRTRLDKDGKVAPGYDEDWEWNHGPYWHSHNRWRYDNLNLKSVENAYRLGVNIVAYLLTR